MTEKIDVNALNGVELKREIKLLLIRPHEPPDGEPGPISLPAAQWFAPRTHIDMVFCPGAPSEISNQADCAKALPFILDKARWAESQGYDAAVVGCMLDPGVAEARRVVRIPIIGIREASLAVAAPLGRQPALVYAGSIPVHQLTSDPEITLRALVKAAGWHIAGGADVLVPRCCFLDPLARRLQAELGLPTIATEYAGLKLAEMYAALGVVPPPPSRASMKKRLRRLVRRIRSIIGIR